jgi:hypothetical protein
VVECLLFNAKELGQEVGWQHEIQPKGDNRTTLRLLTPRPQRVHRPHHTRTTAITQVLTTTSCHRL